MRVFIATDIDDEIRRGMGKLQKQLQAKVDIRKSDVKWVAPEAMHLTLKFLGEIKDEQAVEVCNITKDVAGRYSCFDLDIESVGFFGGSSARVLWVGAGQGKDRLLDLQKDIEQQLTASGWPPETRRFSGHLTLCRVRNPKAGFKLAAITKDYRDFRLGTTSIDSVTVYQSRLTPKGPTYTTLGRYGLK